MAIDSFDVAIAGGGPAGSATAISLLNHAPSLSTILIEASSYRSFRIGETLPPPARAILEHLGVWEAFAAQGHRQTYGTTASWGAESLQPNDYFFFPANIGWHVDRVAFDAMLAEQARGRGAQLMLNARIHGARRSAAKWTLKLSNGRTIDARFLVDATGSAVLARGFGSHFIEEDQLIGIAGVCSASNSDSRTVVEPFVHGWWYTAGLPDDRRVVVLMTDSDIARRLHYHQRDEWERALSQTRYLSSLIGESKLCARAAIKPASSQKLTPVSGDGWLAVGDSASRFDPLSSQGIFKALRSGVFASYAIADLLVRGDSGGLRKYNSSIEAEFKSYLGIRRKYYREEHRWPDSEFWQRRRGDNFPEHASPSTHSSSWKTKSEPGPAADNRLAAPGVDANHIPLA